MDRHNPINISSRPARPEKNVGSDDQRAGKRSQTGDEVTYRRGWIALLIFTVVIINYIDRIALSVAAKPIVAEYGFSPVQMGYLFSGFLWTYVVCLVPLGLLVERIGIKNMVGGGIAIWSTATALTAATGVVAETFRKKGRKRGRRER